MGLIHCAKIVWKLSKQRLGSNRAPNSIYFLAVAMDLIQRLCRNGKLVIMI